MRDRSVGEGKPRRARRRFAMIGGGLEPLESRTLLAGSPLTPRYQANVNGDIVIVANTLMTAPATHPSAVAAQNGTAPNNLLSNNAFAMVHVDVDSDPSTFNSSRAALALPEDASVQFAGLYWLGVSTSGARDAVKFQTPASGGYVSLSGTVVGSDAMDYYEGFADVTALVRAAGNGTYTVANVQALTGLDNASGRTAGWALVVAYADPFESPRNLSVYDGWAPVASESSSVTVTVAGLHAPLSGPVRANIGVVSLEGDLGYSGDGLQLNGVVLSNAGNPADNFFNSSITRLGVPTPGRSPSYINQLGFDADVVAADGIIPNGATSATLTLTSVRDTYAAGVLTAAIDLYAPVAVVPILVTDLNGGEVQPGDVLEYTVVVRNTGSESATNVVFRDTIPVGTTYVPGSLVTTFGRPEALGPQTDAPGDDLAEFVPANNQVVYRIGGGATLVSGGSLAVGEYQTVRFRVLVNANAVPETSLTNQASVELSGASSGTTISLVSTPTRVFVTPSADLRTSLSVDIPRPQLGETVELTLTTSNADARDQEGVRVGLSLPPGLVFLGADPIQGTYDPLTGIWDVGPIGAGQSRVLRFRARVASPSAMVLTATALGSDHDPLPSGGTSTLAITPTSADLRVDLTVDDPTPEVAGLVTLTASVRNDGPDPSTGLTIDLVVPRGLSLVNASASLGSFWQSGGGGFWTVGALAPGALALLTLQAKVLGTAPATTTARISGVGTFDPFPDNDSATVLVVPRSADLRLTSSVDDPSPEPGTVVTFTVNLVNDGPDSARSVLVQGNPLPDGLTFLSATATDGVFDSQTSAWVVGDLGIGAAALLTLRARVDGPGPFATTFLARGATHDPDPSDNFLVVALTPRRADLGVTVTVDDPSPSRSSLVLFTTTVTNKGPDGARRVRVASLLPLGMTLVDSAEGQGTFDPISGFWEVGSIPTGGAAVLTLRARPTAPGASLFTATVEAPDLFETARADNTAAAVVRPRSADLALGMSVDRPIAAVGELITYTLTLANSGPDVAPGVTIQNRLPAGVSLVSAIPTWGAFDPVSGVWTVGSVSPGAPVTLTLTARADVASPAPNEANVLTSDAFESDTANDAAVSSADPAATDLVLWQRVDKSSPGVDDSVTITLTLTNPGGTSANGVQVRDVLPPGLLYRSASLTQGNYNPGTGDWSVGTLAPGASAVLTLRGEVSAAGELVNRAEVVAGPADPNHGNDLSVVTIGPRRADIALSLDVDSPTPDAGSVVTIRLTASNLGPDASDGVFIAPSLPAGLTYLGHSATAGAYDPALGLWYYRPQSPGSSATLWIRARVDAPGPLISTATVAASAAFDPTVANNSATLTITPRRADLALTQTVDRATADVGEILTFTLSLANLAPTATAARVSVSALPAGLSLVDSRAELGTFDPTSGFWDLGGVATDWAPSLILRARANAPGTYTLTAVATPVGAFETATANNVATASTLVRKADLGLTVSVSDPTPNLCDLVRLTIRLDNAGPDQGSGVRVTDLLPEGLVFQSWTATRGAYDPTTGLWTLGSVASRGSAELSIVAKVVGRGPIVNTAAISGSSTFDQNPSNDRVSSVVVTPRLSDLRLTAAFDRPLAELGDLATLTVSVVNQGAAIATGVSARLALPAGFRPEVPGPGPSFDPATGLWSIGNLSPGASALLAIVGRVVDPTRLVVSAEASSTLADSTPSDNAAVATLTSQHADLSLLATVDRPSVNPGDRVTFTVTLSNTGPFPATGVIVSHRLPAGLTFESASPGSGGSYDPSSGNWTPGRVDATSPKILRIIAVADAATTLSDTFWILTADQYDSNPSNNAAVATVAPRRADLGLSAVVDRSSPNVGDMVRITLTLRNNGPDAAGGVSIVGLLPSGLSLINAAVGQGAYDASAGLWSINALLSGTSTTLTLNALVTGPEPANAVWTVATSDTTDPGPAPNTASLVVTPRQSALALSAAVDNASPAPGAVVSLTMTLSNGGPDSATGVVVSAPIPAGLVLVGATEISGTYDPITGRWVAGSVAPGASARLVLLVKVPGPLRASFPASVISMDQHDSTVNDNSASVSIVSRGADLSLVQSIDESRPDVGSVVTITTVLRNLGPDDATGVVSAVPVPAGLFPIDVSADRGTYDPGTGEWSIPVLENGRAATLVIRALVLSPLSQPTAASVLRSDLFDPNTLNDASPPLTVTPRQADVGISIAVDKRYPTVGELLTFTVVLKSQGPDSALAVRVSNRLSTGLALVSATPSQGTFDPATGTWDAGGLAPTSSATLTLTARVIATGEHSAAAQILTSSRHDPDHRNNAAIVALGAKASVFSTVESVQAGLSVPSGPSTITSAFQTVVDVSPDSTPAPLAVATPPPVVSLATEPPAPRALSTLRGALKHLVDRGKSATATTRRVWSPVPVPRIMVPPPRQTAGRGHARPSPFGPRLGFGRTR